MLTGKEEQRMYALVLKVYSSGMVVDGAKGWENNVVSFIEDCVEKELGRMEQEPSEEECSI